MTISLGGSRTMLAMQASQTRHIASTLHGHQLFAGSKPAMDIGMAEEYKLHEQHGTSDHEAPNYSRSLLNGSVQVESLSSKYCCLARSFIPSILACNDTNAQWAPSHCTLGCKQCCSCWHATCLTNRVMVLKSGPSIRMIQAHHDRPYSSQ